MTNYLNTAETGLAQGATVTTSNSGGSAGTGLTVVTSGSGTMTSDNTVKHRGNSSFKATVLNATNELARLDFAINSANAAMEPYYYLTAYPSAETAIAQIRNPTHASVFVNINASGQLRLYNDAGAAINLTTGSVPLNAWWRLALVAVKGTTTSNGTIRFAYYSGANLDTTTPNETAFVQSGSANTGVDNFNSIRFMKPGSNVALTIWGDDFQWSDSASNFLGPVASSPPVISYSKVRFWEIDPSASTGTGNTYTLVQQSGSTVTITGPDANNKFKAQLPATVATAAVLRLGATDQSGQVAQPVDITIDADGTVTQVIDKDFLVYNGTAWE